MTCLYIIPEVNCTFVQLYIYCTTAITAATNEAIVGWLDESYYLMVKEL